MGGCDVLWLETTHFKIGSTLGSYRMHNDTREAKALAPELARLKSKLAEYKPPRVELEPWLRLHLYALRLEDLHADFVERFGYQDRDPAAKPSTSKGASKASAPDDPEPPQKIRVLLAGRTSALARYVKHHANRELTGYDRFPLAGGAQFVGVDEEGMRTAGYELDIALHCVVSGAVSHSLIEAFTGGDGTVPMWLEFGLDHVVTRAIDERYPTAPANTIRIEDESSLRWETRVRGLVLNDVAPSWADLSARKGWADFKPSDHLVAWSRVAWLLKRKPAELRAFLEGVTGPPELEANGEIPKTAFGEQSAAAKKAFGKTLEELDKEWRKQASR